jgi:hypothetical protein
MEIPLKELSETQYGIKIQKEMVAMLGLSATALALIVENTRPENSTVTLSGRVLNQSLLNAARRQYGVAKTA